VKRTRAILLLGLLLMAKGLVLLVAFGTLLAGALNRAQDVLTTTPPSALPQPTRADLVEATAYLVVGVFVLIGSFGLLRLRGWGWLLAMIGQGIALVLGLVAYVSSQPNYLLLLIDVLLVFYLNHYDVYVVFANAKRRDGVLHVVDDANGAQRATI
jgi:predicted membrane channel-forming protein YqfA (hemolysin III family)